MSVFPRAYLRDIRNVKPPMKDITPPPAALPAPKPKGKKRMAILPHEYLLPDCV